MIAPLASLLFLGALWIVVKVALDMLAHDGSKMLAALKGQSLMAQPPRITRAISVRYQPRAGSVHRPVHVQPEWRAAA